MISEQRLRKAIRRAVFSGDYRSQKQYAISIGVHPATVSYFMSGKRHAGPKLLKALGYRQVVLFEKTKRKGR